MNELGSTVGLPTGAVRDLLEFCMHRAGTESADAHTGSAKFGAERFREAGDIRFCGSVNSKVGDRKKTSGRTDVQNAAASPGNHLRKQAAGEGGKRDHVYQHHLLGASEIASRERTAIAETRVVDQKIDIDVLALKPCRELFDLREVGEISFANLNPEAWMLLC